MTQEFFERPFYMWSGYVLLLWGFVLILVLQLVYYRRLLVKKKGGDDVAPERGISILLNIRNESARIESFLMKLLGQNYSNFEIIVVDDFSADSTLIILGVMSRKYPQIKFSSLNQENRSSEKMAMNLALKAAKHDWVLFLSPETNLDDPGYLAKLNAAIDDETEAVVGYLNYDAGTGRYNRWSRLERLRAFWNASANQAASIPVIYQQINVLFHKKIYFEAGGFKGIMNAHFAGLELIFNQLKKLNVKYTIAEGTRLREDKLADRYEYDDLMRKHVRLYRRLPLGKKRLNILGFIAKLLLFSGIGFLLFSDLKYWFFFTPVPVILWLIDLFLTKSVLKRLAERKIFLSSLAYVFVRPVLYLFYSTSTRIQAHRSKWN